MEMAGPNWASTGQRDLRRAVAYSHTSCHAKVLAGCSHPPEKHPSPAWWQHPWEGHRGAPTAGIGEHLAASQVENHPAGCSSVASGLQRARPSRHVCPAYTQCVCTHGVSWHEYIPADMVCAPVELRVCTPRCVSSCARHVCTPMRTHACTGACAQCAGRPACICRWARTRSGPGPSPGALARQVCGPGEPVCLTPFTVSACSSWLPAGVCVLYLPVAGKALGDGLQNLC